MSGAVCLGFPHALQVKYRATLVPAAAILAACVAGRLERTPTFTRTLTLARALSVLVPALVRILRVYKMYYYPSLL